MPRFEPSPTKSFLSASYQKYDFAVELPSSKYRLIQWAHVHNEVISDYKVVIIIFVQNSLWSFVAANGFNSEGQGLKGRH